MARSVDIDIILNDRFSANAERIAQSVRDISQQFQTATANAENLSKSVSGSGNLSRGITNVAAKTKSMTDNMRHFGQVSERVGRNLFRRVTLPILSIGGVMAASAVGFESSMLRVRSISQANQQEFEALRESARTAGRDSVFSNREAGEAQQFLSQAGFSTQQVIAALPGTLDLAAAAQMGLAQAADISTNIMSVFSIEAEHAREVGDTLAFMNAATNVSVEQLGQAFKFAGVRASSMGLDMKDAAAALGILGDSGLQGGLGGTTMRAMMDRLLLPTGNASKVLQALNIDVLNADGSIRHLFDIMEDFADRGASPQALAMVFGTRGSQGGAIMQARIGEIIQLREEADEAGGISGRMAATNIAGVAGSIRLLRSAFADLSQEMFDEDVLMSVRGVIISMQQSMLGFSDELTPASKKSIAFGGITLAALGPVAMALGKIVLMGGLIARFKLGGAFLGMIGPALLAAGAIAAIVVTIEAVRRAAKRASEEVDAAEAEGRPVKIEKFRGSGILGFTPGVLPSAGQGLFEVEDVAGKRAIGNAISAMGDFFSRSAQAGAAGVGGFQRIGKSEVGASGFQRIAAAEVGVAGASRISADDRLGKIEVDVDVNDPGGHVKSVKVASKGSSRLDMGSNFSGVR